ncbi:MAG TPA: hypothetical protein DCY03_16505, partial [Planctomycetaceae bacterium]|nr:hypothetical protein [Planctomycetaceae bacterium]
MKTVRTCCLLILFLTLTTSSASAADDWVTDSQKEWQAAAAGKDNIDFKEGTAIPTDKTASFTSKVKRYDHKQKAKSIIIEQSPIWQNWEPVANLGPVNLQDAPVFLAIGPNNYWVFGRYGGVKKKKGFKAEPATLDGFDVKLQTTPWKHQYDAPGGLEKGLGGYHGWQS